MNYRLGWCSDIHLNFLNHDKRQVFYNRIIEAKIDGLMITGDIAESRDVCEKLLEMKLALNTQIFFVLGNHDFWHSSIQKVRLNMLSICDEKLFYLVNSVVIPLINDTFILGVDGFADGRLGDYKNSDVNLWDSLRIGELYKGSEATLPFGFTDKRILLKNMKKVALKDSINLREKLYYAANSGAKRIIVATHVPPFKEVSKYRGEISNDFYLPFYTSHCIGNALMDFANDHPEIQVNVYCGHTHGAAFYEPLANLTVEAGEATYCYPILQKVIILEG